jgi:hypothetical protein
MIYMGHRKLYPIFNSPFTTVENWVKKTVERNRATKN